ncbi:MAG: insulinase family protein [Myxococcales bacterium]|nr:insulinase family protein [Myxococcales bacterium]
MHVRFAIITWLSILLWPLASAASDNDTPEVHATQKAPQLDFAIQQEVLSNGLRIVLNPDNTVPTVALAIYYDVGSRDEAPGSTGFAHLFEHMMFQGSANVTKGQHISIIENRGGRMNGTTNSDRTNYFEVLPSNELELGLWLEADRMKSLNITKENFENQRQTVMEERRQSIDNQPYGPSMLRINELAYGAYFPYAHSTIGDMADLQKAPLAAVQKFFDTYYAPNNAVLVLAGDFETQAAIRLIQKYFGGIPRRATKVFSAPLPDPQTSERTETMSDDNAELPAFHIAYHIPPDRTPDHYALELLAVILGDGESSRMYQALVKKKELLQDIQISTDGRRGPDLFSVWGITSRGKDSAAARQILYSELNKIAKQGVSDRELEKAKNRTQSEFVFGLESNLERALSFGAFELYYGDARLICSELAYYLDVTRDDIKRVAEKYFSAENRTVLDVVPKHATTKGDPS